MVGVKLLWRWPALHRARGFTLVELVIVISVISVLATITVVAYSGVVARANDTQRTAAVAAVRKALDMYRADIPLLALM